MPRLRSTPAPIKISLVWLICFGVPDLGAAGSERQTVEIARDLEGEPVRLHPQCAGVLIAGASGGGKSTAATGLIENIAERGFQLCVIDPEGDYADLEGALVLGDANSPPRLPEIVELLGKPEQNVVVNLLRVDIADRPRFLAELMPALSRLRVESARPHWLVIDEAHHLLPAAWNGASLVLPQEFAANILITVQPEHVATEALQRIDYILALGGKADSVLAPFCKAVGDPAPEPVEQSIDRGRGLFWSRRSDELRMVSTIHHRQEQATSQPQICGGRTRRGQALLFSGSRRRSKPAGAEPGLLSAACRRHRRPDLAAPFARRRLFAVAQRQNQRRRTCRRCRAHRKRRGTDAAVESRRRIKEAIERRYTSPA